MLLKIELFGRMVSNEWCQMNGVVYLKISHLNAD